MRGDNFASNTRIKGRGFQNNGDQKKVLEEASGYMECCS